MPGKDVEEGALDAMDPLGDAASDPQAPDVAAGPVPNAQEEVPVLVLRPGEDALRSWATSIAPGTPQVFVRFPRRGDLPLAVVQRLARRAALIVDARPESPEDVLDLAVAGATGLVAWLQDGGDVAGMGEAMGEGFLVGCRGPDLAMGLAIARGLEAPILVEADQVPAAALGWHGYRLDLGGSPPMLRRFGTWPDQGARAMEGDGEPPTADPDHADADDPGAEDEPAANDGEGA